MKKSFVSTLVVLLAVGILGYVFWGSLFPAEVQAPANVTATSRVMAVEDYIKLNISILSPIKENVGGKYYVTAVEAYGRTGAVSYEDGHNAYIADFTYTTDENKGISITSWTLR